MTGRLWGVVGALLLCLVMTSCGHQVEEEDWRADVEAELGRPISDWDTYRDTWLETCDQDETGFGLFLAAAMDGGTTLDTLRTNVRHACPDRLDELEETQAGLDDVDRACSIPPADRTDSQERLAEAMGC